VSHRSGRAPRRTAGPDRRLLVAGIVLVATAIGMGTFEPLHDALTDAPAACPESLVQHGGPVR